MALPIDVRDLYRFGKQITDDRDEPVELAVFIEVDAPESLLEAAKEALRPRTAQAYVDVSVLESGVAMSTSPSTDAVVVLAGSGGAEAAELAARMRAARVPIVALALAEDGQPLEIALGMPSEDVLADPEPGLVIEEKLAAWLADRLGGKRLAVALNLEFTRSAVALELVKATALQNTLIGTVTIIPGTDMPIMTANQAKMLLQLATAYGQSIGSDRLGELAAVVGGGFAFRAIARQALTAVPGFGWAIKGGIAYTGTMAMGRAAIAWFEQGADVNEVAKRLKGLGKREPVLEVANEPATDGPVQQTLVLESPDDA